MKRDGKNLRDLLLLRRKVHKLFDMIKCDNFDTLISSKQFKDNKFLVLRDCYLTFDLLANPDRLEKVLNDLFKHLRQHMKSCQVSKIH